MDLFSMEWPRHTAGYRLVDRPSANAPGTIADLGSEGEHVEPIGTAVETYNPFRIDGIYHHLAGVQSGAEALRFTNAFGPLWQISASGIASDLILSEASRLRQMIELAEQQRWKDLAASLSGNRPHIGTSAIWFGVDQRSGRPSLQVRPRTLASAIHVQFALDCTGGARLRKCLWCENWFKYGAGTGKRNTAVYCSPRCQKAHAYAKTKEAQS